MKLSGPQRIQLRDALLEAFPTRQSLRDMMFYRMEQNLEAIAATESLSGDIQRLIMWAEARDQVETLIVAACEDNPTNATLKDLATQVAVYVAAPQGDYLERVVLPAAPFVDPEEWRARMRRCEAAVCRVEYPLGKPWGTGFLAGPSVLITNYHVVDKVIKQKVAPTDVVLRFDYKAKEDGVAVRKGREIRLAGTNWLLDSSRVKELDYALLRLESKFADERMGADPQAPSRGWLVPIAHTFQPEEPLVILQHPEGKPLKMAVGPAVKTLPSQRVEHKVNTEPGSSGSPVFTTRWELVALHHYGNETKNRAVLFSAILDRMKQQRALDLLGT